MAGSVVFDAVTRSDHPATKLRIRSGAFTNAKKRGSNVMLREDRQYLRCYLWVRTVIDGNCHFTSLYRSGG